MKKILGIGNALVDIMIELDNDLILKEFGLPKGSMQLVDKDKSSFIDNNTNNFPKKLAAGGSASNTIYGLAKLGADVGFIGKVGADKMGEFFGNDLESNNIKPLLLKSDDMSGRAMALVTPDSERTFATFLGAAVGLSDKDLNSDMFASYNILHVEGYLVQNHDLMIKALQLAKENGLKVSLDLASYNVVDDNLEFLKQIVSEYVDIVFANEEEAKSFTGMEPEEALEELSKNCEYAIVKIGKEGSLIKYNNQVTEIGVIDVKSIDTTGAGDLYAAGFLYGLTKDFSMKDCGTAGSILAGRVIESIGARIPDSKWEEINSLIQLM